MSRLWKFLPLAVVFAALSVFTSCNSNSAAKVRVINAIPDVPGGAVDVYLNTTTGTKLASSLGLGQMNPSTNPPATYTDVLTGKNEIDVYLPGQTTPFNRGFVTFTGSTEYTLVLDGRYIDKLNPAQLTDNNTAPNTGNLSFRVVNASAWADSNLGSVDVYIYQQNSGIPTTPQISGLAIGQASAYTQVAYSSTAGYTVTVTQHSAGPFSNYYVNQNYNPANGSISTLVLVDEANGGPISPTPLLITDLK